MLKDLKVIRWGYPWMILWVCTVHVVIGACLLLDSATERLLIFSGLNRFTELPLIDGTVLGIFLIAFAILAFIGLVLEGRLKPKQTLAFLIWQYGLVICTFLSDLIVIWNGENPATGQELSRFVILVVLAPLLLAGPYHTLSILERFVLKPHRDAS